MYSAGTVVPGGAKYLENEQLSHPQFILTVPILGEYGLNIDRCIIKV